MSLPEYQQKNNIVRALIYTLMAAIFLWLLSSVNVATAENKVGGADKSQAIPVPNPATDLWRAVRQREGSTQAASTQVKGVGTNVLVLESGEKFRSLRSEKIIPYMPYLLLAAVGLVALFYFTRGQVKIEGGPAGHDVLRFNEVERFTHWFLTIIFIFLALTGLIMLFGRFFVIPIFGKEAFGLIANACKVSHNLVGPFFLVAVILMFVMYVSKNMPHLSDIKWLLKGGLFFGHHVKAGFFNTGEKIWFWLTITLGLILSVTGLILDFPIFGQGRDTMQLSLIIHAITAVIFTAVAIGHIFLATLGTEGTSRGMTTGKVDVNWAKTHHDLWYEKLDEPEAITEEKTPAAKKAGGTAPVQT